MNTPTTRSHRALFLLAAYVHEPLQCAIEGAELCPDAATRETLLMMVRIASARLVALTEAGPAVLTSSRRARAWIESRRAPFRAAASGAAR